MLQKLFGLTPVFSKLVVVKITRTVVVLIRSDTTPHAAQHKTLALHRIGPLLHSHPIKGQSLLED
jgi:hypothetical protein